MPSVALQRTSPSPSIYLRISTSITAKLQICDHSLMTANENNTDVSVRLDDAQPSSLPHPGLFLRHEIVEGRELRACLKRVPAVECEAASSSLGWATSTTAHTLMGQVLSVGEAVETLRVLQPTWSAVLNGRAALSPEMVLHCEKASGLSMDALMSMQCAYDAA